MGIRMRIGMALDATKSYISRLLSWAVGLQTWVNLWASHCPPPPFPAVAGIALSSCKEINSGFDDGTRGKGVSRQPNIPIQVLF